MSQVVKKYIQNNAIDGTKINFNNDEYFRVKDNSGNDLNLFKVNNTNELEFNLLPKIDLTPTSDTQLTNKYYVDTALPTGTQQNFTLTATDISNGYILLSESVNYDSVIVIIEGALQTSLGSNPDYSLSENGNYTQITFLNDLLSNGETPLQVGDYIEVKASVQTSQTNAPSIVGSNTTPIVISSSGILFSGHRYFNTWYIKATSDNLTISANPQIVNGNIIGQQLTLLGRDNSYKLILANGNGLELNGNITLGLGDSIILEWTGSAWIELARNS